MATRERICLECEGQFQYETGRGADRVYCTEQCRRSASRRSEASAVRPVCSVPDCTSAVRSGRSTFCEVHYYRIRRTGSHASPEHKGRSIQPSGYVVARVKSHPLETAGQKGRIYEHRKVYFDAYGSGPFECHVCRKQLTWSTLDIDHLNDDKSDNRLANLAPACPPAIQEEGNIRLSHQGPHGTLCGWSLPANA